MTGGAPLVLDLAAIGRDHVGEVGGKAAHLGELTRIPGVTVPPGFCVTTHAFAAAVAGAPGLDGLLARLGAADPADRAAIATASAEVRALIAALPVPDAAAAELTGALAAAGDGTAWAVRSSATAEDLPDASFAGQQDTYLGVVGAAAVLAHVARCWASLFTERAVTYRRRHGIDERDVRMAVVVQRMVAPRASGVLFTADPVTSHRRTAVVEAVPGLGEALVSGVADPDRWTVRDGAVLERSVATAPAAVLDDDEVLALVALGRRIEARLGVPQDVEWCRTADGFAIVQARPITTLFPVPQAGDDALRVYLSVGHQQMMTDAMTPLGRSYWQRTTPRPMAEAGSRLFVDISGALADPTARAGLLEMMGRSDPLVRDAVETVLGRGAFGDAPPVAGPAAPAPSSWLDADPGLVGELVAESRASLAAAERDVAGRHGEDLFAFLDEDMQELRRLLFDRRAHAVFTTAMDASFWLDEHLHTWLGESGAADTLTLSAPGNVTSEMGLALLDVADVVRPHPAVVAHLRALHEDDDLDGLPALPGGRAAHDALTGFLDTYGARCVGEIDIARTRWSERPATLVPLLLSHVDAATPGEGRRRAAEGERRAQDTARDVLARLRALPGGDARADETAAMIDRLRTFIGFREYPKFGMVRRYLIHKRALLAEADRLVAAGVLRCRTDAFFLHYDELREVARSGRADHDLIRERRATHAAHRRLTPPRVLTSDGETLSGSFHRDDLPDGALAGIAVSRGTVEGRARVVPDMARADLVPGDVLVTVATDPSWSPAFVTIAGLVTEVGGTMTHGAVVAREYGLPAVVGVAGATREIRDGQRIRVHGTDGYVELL
ncbi:phosphoenolpyruvate synthase [Pseudonocardia spirodelae]|uniref:Phosphoenolpyruvate synthase n=1 Tax=Pseudonocardia spirodelae TaxID=3133431 RepID=A0ABU8T2P0_9PSEU